MPHAYLLVSPAVSAREEQSKALAQKLLCARSNAPCGLCRDCRKVQAGNHPDLIWLRRQSDDKGKTRREITVDQVRAVTADAAVAPNEAERKVYIIPEADTMNAQAQNALLKALEDPPGHACFILCTAASDALLPTVLSRLVRARTAAEDETDAPDAMEPFAAEYLALVASDDKTELARFCMLRAALSGDEALAFVDGVKTLLWRALRGERPVSGLSGSELLALDALMDKAALYLRRNLGARQVFGMLMTADRKGTNINWQQ